MNTGVDFAHSLCKRFGCLKRAEIPNNHILPLGADCYDLIALGPGSDLIGDHPPTWHNGSRNASLGGSTSKGIPLDTPSGESALTPLGETQVKTFDPI
jgi:hypothetical protein